jgi:hypothetical protein
MPSIYWQIRAGKGWGMTRVGTLLMVSLMGIGGTREPSPSILKGKCHFRHCPKWNNGAKMPWRAKHDLSDSGTRTLASCYSDSEAEVALSEDGGARQLFYRWGRRRRGAPPPQLVARDPWWCVHRVRCLDPNRGSLSANALQRSWAANLDWQNIRDKWNRMVALSSRNTEYMWANNGLLHYTFATIWWMGLTPESFLSINQVGILFPRWPSKNTSQSVYLISEHGDIYKPLLEHTRWSTSCQSLPQTFVIKAKPVLQHTRQQLCLPAALQKTVYVPRVF